MIDMATVSDIFLLLGSITVFLFGLKKLSADTGELCGGKLDYFVRKATSNRFGGVLAGMISTSVLQSSVATNVIAITLVEKGVIDFFACAAVVMGTNIGTTITGQLVSLSAVFDFEPSAIGGVIAFIGMILSLFNNKKVKSAGGALLGFGFLFVGLGMMTESAANFKKYYWFTSLFLVENPVVLFLNGLVVTAILQSSSVVTSIIIVLSSVGLVSFDSAAFLILGANVGTCLPVIIASADMSEQSRKSAYFNLAFNIFGTLLFFFPLLSDRFIGAIPFFNTPDTGRNIANFHTFFNLAVCVVMLPILKPFCGLIEKIFSFFDRPKRARKTRRKSEVNA